MSAISIAVTNQKGGVGKTTTAVNLAAYLSDAGYNTLLVDLDPQANATSGVGVVQGKLTHTLYDLIADPSTLTDVIYPTSFPNLHLIPSNQNLAGAEVELVTVDDPETLLTRCLAPADDYYDFVVLDCPPSLSQLTVNALVYAKYAMVPVQCEYFALEGLAHLINTIELVRDNSNPELEILGIVLTMFDRRTALNKLVVANARSFFDGLVFETVVPRNIRLAEAPSHGLPIALYRPASRGADAYEKITEEVLNRVNKSAAR